MSSSSSASPCYKMQALSWHAEDVMDDEDDTMKYTIKIFGLDTMNRSMSVTVKGFPPHFFLKMNDEWASNDMRVFANYTCDTVLKGLDPVPYDRRGKDFWGFTNNKEFKFLRLSFPSLTNMRRAVAILGKHKKTIRSLSNVGGGGGPYQYQLYESNIEPYLRFIHLRGLEPCGWIDFSGAVTETDVLESTCKRDIEVHFSKVVPATEIESGVVAKFLVASFDIECTSMGGEFPIPQKDYRLLASQLYDLIVSMKKTGASDYDIKVTCKSAILYALFGSASSSSEAAGYNEKTSTIKVSRVDPKEAKKPSIISEYLETMVIDDLVMILQGGSSGSAAAGSSAAASVKGSRERIVTSATLFLNKASNTLLPKLQGDPIIQIGTTFHKYGDTEICKRVIITLGTCAHIEGPNREEIEVIETKTEAEMLIKWRDMVVREDPDIVTGYNIFGFDFDYMMKRATELGVNRAFLQLSRFKGHVCKFTEQKLSSSALGDNVLKFVDMKGRVIVDLMKVIQRDHKLDSYKLDLVAQHFTGNAKMDVSPQEIFALQKGSAEDRGKIASYCIQDCALCNQLVMKLEIVANNMGMSNVCLVPMEYIFLRGQGIKIFSLLLNECQKEKFLIPCVKREISIRAEDIESLEPVSLLQENRSKVVKAIDASAADLLKMAKTNDAIDVLKPSAVTAAIISLASRKHHVDVGLEHLQKKFIYLQRNDFESACRILTAAAIAATASSAAAAKERKEKGVTDDDDDDEKGKSGGNPEDDSYEGAIVLDPKQGIYIDDPISVLDYASLYPNSMISENLSHDCLVLDSAYDNLPGVEYLDITYDLFDDKKNRVGEHTCRFAQSQMGIIPKILKKLLAARKATRKKMTYMTGSSLKGGEVTGIWSAKTGTITTPEGLTVEVLKETVKPTYNSFQVAVLDGLQSAYKVTANSLYGQIGARTSQIYLKEIAACTTATGRKMILKAKEFLESKPGVEVIYGDSVTGYTPCILRESGTDGHILIKKIEDIAERYGIRHGNQLWISCSRVKWDEENAVDGKEACEIEGLETWTSGGWTKLHRVIRHKLAPHKKILRILTHTGVVDVTDEHSLIDGNHEIVDAKSIKIGDELLHCDLPRATGFNGDITPNKARIMGMFMGDGSGGCYKCPSGDKASWAINNSDYKMLEEYKVLCEEEYAHLTWKILPTLESSGVYKLVPGSILYGSVKEFVQQYRDLLYDGQDKIVPMSILNSTNDIKLSFWKGLYDADGDKDKHGYTRIDQDSQVSANTIYLLGISLGFKVSINTRRDKQTVYRLTMTNGIQRKPPNVIKKIEEVSGYNGYVYDLTTENHEFAAGVGRIIVHNTDSIFVRFPAEGKKGHAKIMPSIEQATEASAEFRKLIKAPHDLEYEKTFWPFILLSKKRYVGNLYEHDDQKFKQKSMGIVLKRRDNAQIVKKIYGGVLNIILTRQDVPASVEFLKESLLALVKGKTSIDDLVISKSLKADYKDPTRIAHKVLADRIAERDPGSKFQSSDRVPYVYVVTPAPAKGQKILQGEKIETPAYIKEQSLVPDYGFYITNQIMKPLLQLYSLVIEELPGYDKPPGYFDLVKRKLEADIKGVDAEEKVKDKLEVIKEVLVKQLLFDPMLTMLEQKIKKSLISRKYA